jgi:diguanylate cyclase (GGDEF)-like protein
MADTQCLSIEQLLYFLDRHKKNESEAQDFNFQTALKKVLDELRDFVPCEGMYVLLDEPMAVIDDTKPKNLVYVAGNGDKASSLVGLKTVSNQGLISQAYKLGSMQTIKSESEKAVLDKIHLPKEVKNAICQPLKINTATIGVLAIYNKEDPMGFTMKDIRMINTLSGYLCMSIQSAMDAKKNKELTKRDTLSGLYNDRYFHSQLEREIFSAERTKSDLTLIFFDLDNFKSINDQHGHLVGSQTLKEVGFVFREVMSVPNATLARYGGDEYVCILPGVNVAKAVELSNVLREKINEKRFMIDQGTEDGAFVSFKGVISASIGIASLHEHTLPIEDTKQRKNALVRLADQAMYQAKALGKNQVCVAKTPME